MKKLRKTAITMMALMLVLAMCFSTSAFADNNPSGNGMGGGPGGQQPGTSQQGGNGSGQQGGNGSGRPEGQTPPDMNQGNNPNSKPDGAAEGSTDGNPNDEQNGAQPGNKPGDGPMGINMMAVEAYLDSEDADENVRAAYDALQAALAGNPEDGAETDIAELEEALEEALENAGIDLGDYESDEIKPEDEPELKDETQPDGAQPGNKPEEEPPMGVNMMAVEAYLDSEDADENVRAAYDALQAALAGNPEDGAETDIAELEEALEDALETVGIDLGDYESDEIKPEDEPELKDDSQPKPDTEEKPLPEDEAEPENNADTPNLTDEEVSFIKTLLDKLFSLFR